MHSGRFVFSQVMDHLPMKAFRRCVQRYQGNRHVQSFTCLDQFLCMAFAQLTFRESLRDIEACLRAHEDKLYHMGIRGGMSRNTLANATPHARQRARMAARPFRPDRHRRGRRGIPPDSLPITCSNRAVLVQGDSANRSTFGNSVDTTPTADDRKRQADSGPRRRGDRASKPALPFVRRSVCSLDRRSRGREVNRHPADLRPLSARTRYDAHRESSASSIGPFSGQHA